ncbi:hypothetical protein B0H65DRAFT_94942 [Neurospora tetraspora]|uniref:Uncharacterized protein n=1 Tax=Neurospora tetraspora TaxID=94610 RepID=A0AAE0MV51_9PEZI|nr:hypothetical protein B0H65DRAFT_94942 [Neurospora tetraspora]
MRGREYLPLRHLLTKAKRCRNAQGKLAALSPVSGTQARESHALHARKKKKKEKAGKANIHPSCLVFSMHRPASSTVLACLLLLIPTAFQAVGSVQWKRNENTGNDGERKTWKSTRKDVCSPSYHLCTTGAISSWKRTGRDHAFLSMHFFPRPGTHMFLTLRFVALKYSSVAWCLEVGMRNGRLHDGRWHGNMEYME